MIVCPVVKLVLYLVAKLLLPSDNETYTSFLEWWIWVIINLGRQRDWEVSKGKQPGQNGSRHKVTRGASLQYRSKQSFARTLTFALCRVSFTRSEPRADSWPFITWPLGWWKETIRSNCDGSWRKVCTILLTLGMTLSVLEAIGLERVLPHLSIASPVCSHWFWSLASQP